jgi:7,8-dihydropterin-6-yl-methyl-4-(beta-D-ribofuranosyl)aminobenzene 5'-phosphate synthase
LEVKIVIENMVYKQGYFSEHGLSILINEAGKKILFDTGQSKNVINNLEQLGENVEDIDYIVLSHGHYDHTGGLKYVLEKNNKAKVILKKEALEYKVSTSTGVARDISFPIRETYMDYENEFIFIEGEYKITDNIKIVGQIEKNFEFEDDEKRLFIQKEELVKDPFLDELFMTIVKDKKINLFTGCAHSGILNILQTAAKRNDNADFGIILGGTHLKGKSDIRIINTLKELEKYKFDKLYVCHCTGIEEYVYLKSKFGERSEYAHTAKIIKIK